MQGVIPLLVGTPRILRPVARSHAGIGAIIDLTGRVDLHKKGIAAEFEMVNRILQQLFFLRDWVLLPLALQIYLAFALQVSIWGTS